MTTPHSIDENLIRGWMDVLDDVSYYELFGLPSDATADDIRHAFHRFAYSFHPDQHRERSPKERASIDAIFKRGNEAFLVLSDPFLRSHYDTELQRATQPPRITTLTAPRQMSDRPMTLEDKVRTPSAKPFARRAEELVALGDFKQAKLQMVMARHRDEGNAELDAYMRFIEERLKPKG